jgi:hypothetical protein
VTSSLYSGPGASRLPRSETVLADVRSPEAQRYGAAAAEAGDRETLRRLADLGSTDATALLVEIATEAEDLAELARLADAGSSDARDVLDELTGEGE